VLQRNSVWQGHLVWNMQAWSNESTRHSLEIIMTGGYFSVVHIHNPWSHLVRGDISDFHESRRFRSGFTKAWHQWKYSWNVVLCDSAPIVTSWNSRRNVERGVLCSVHPEVISRGRTGQANHPRMRIVSLQLTVARQTSRRSSQTVAPGGSAWGEKPHRCNLLCT
jgi:hypothetical protein